ncbi:MAG: AmmeMemoRadiSam system radical SAM enzyme [Bacteroidota bacterium]
MEKRDFVKYLASGLGCMMCYPVAGIASGRRSMFHHDKLWRYNKESFYYSETPRGIKCLVCPNECTLKPGETSDCRNRVNHENKLYSIAYGNPCAVHVDPVEKKPLYHFQPESKVFSIATAGCNFGCLNCQNWTISQSSPKETKNYDLFPEDVVASAINRDCKSIAYTYAEPITFYEYMYDTAKIAREQGIKNIMVSNGYINEKPLRDLCRYIDAANIDLKSYSDDVYLKLNAGKLQPVLEGLKTMKDEGVWIEITNLVIPGWNDNMDMIKRMCNWLLNNGMQDSPLHFSRFLPQYKLTQLPPTPPETLKNARKTALSEGIRHVYIGNLPGANAESTYCSNCGEIVLERRGFRILKNNMTNGKCSACKSVIAGIWT